MELDDDLVFVDGVAFVIWKWEWVNEHYEYASDGESRTSTEIIPETPPLHGSDHDNGEEPSLCLDGATALKVCPQVTHTVTFKCIGTTKENKYQENLARISQLRIRGIIVPCRVKAEPNNPYDSKPIAFECQVDGVWCIIGYVVREALDELHDAMAGKKITQVSLAWVKFQLFWSAIGWYAGVNITCSGQWSLTILRCQSSIVSTR